MGGFISGKTDNEEITFCPYCGEPIRQENKNKNGTVYLDVNAGYNNEQAILRAASHELTHFIQEYGDDSYSRLRDHIRNQISDIDWSKQIEKEKAKLNRQEYSSDELLEKAAEDEVIANACEMMLKNSEAINKLHEQDLSTFNVVKKWIDGVVTKLRNLVAKLRSKAWEGIEYSEDVVKLLDDWEETQRLWDEALVEASNKYNGTESEIKQPSYIFVKKHDKIKKIDIEEIKKLAISNQKRVINMSPIESVSDEMFRKKDGAPLSSRVLDYYDSIGNSAYNNTIGYVDLLKSGIDDDIAHGIGRVKAITFKVVPKVIEEGLIVDYQVNWKGRDYDTIVIAAPINITGNSNIAGEYITAVIVIREIGSKNQRFYVQGYRTKSVDG